MNLGQAEKEMMNAQREAFEKFILRDHHESFLERYGEDSVSSGVYKWSKIQLAWEAWQAGCLSERGSNVE